MRNEGAHALEWIAHHRAAGVDGFVIYADACDDVKSRRNGARCGRLGIIRWWSKPTGWRVSTVTNL